jgi:enamine deaminase RidA (YjgF/YER057c/UK114 family)
MPSSLRQGWTNQPCKGHDLYDNLLPDFMQAAGEALPSPPPATTLLMVKALAAPPLLVEIEAVAVA